MSGSGSSCVQLPLVQVVAHRIATGRPNKAGRKCTVQGKLGVPSIAYAGHDLSQTTVMDHASVLRCAEATAGPACDVAISSAALADNGFISLHFD